MTLRVPTFCPRQPFPFSPTLCRLLHRFVILHSMSEEGKEGWIIYHLSWVICECQRSLLRGLFFSLTSFPPPQFTPILTVSFKSHSIYVNIHVPRSNHKSIAVVVLNPLRCPLQEQLGKSSMIEKKYVYSWCEIHTGRKFIEI